MTMVGISLLCLVVVISAALWCLRIDPRTIFRHPVPAAPAPPQIADPGRVSALEEEIENQTIQGIIDRAARVEASYWNQPWLLYAQHPHVRRYGYPPGHDDRLKAHQRENLPDCRCDHHRKRRTENDRYRLANEEREARLDGCTDCEWTEHYQYCSTVPEKRLSRRCQRHGGYLSAGSEYRSGGIVL